jgi:transketolase
LADAAGGKPDVILIGTGSEVSLCVAAYEQLQAQGTKARVVSLPSWDIFERQSEAYKNEILPPLVKARVAVEAGSIFGWSRFLGEHGTVIGMHSFGASAPAKELFKKFGFTVEAVLAAARETLSRSANK